MMGRSGYSKPTVADWRKGHLDKYKLYQGAAERKFIFQAPRC